MAHFSPGLLLKSLLFQRGKRRAGYIEILEQRIAPASTATWTGAIDNNWNNVLNWNIDNAPADHVPGTAVGDATGLDVVINPSGEQTIAVNGAFDVHSLAMAGDDHISFTTGGSLTVEAASSIHNGFQMTNGTLTANGLLTVNGSSTIANNASTIIGHIENDGTLTITGGDPNLGNNAATTTLDNTGTIVNSGARLDFAGKATLNNSGLFDITFDGSGDFADNFNSGNLFHNSGTLRREGTSPGTATIDQVPFQNDAGGIIDVVKGTLELNTSGTMAGGDFHAASGATLYLSGGASFTLTGSYGDTGSHDGQVLFDNGTLTAGVGGVTFNFPSGYFNWSSNAATMAGGTFNNAATGFIQITGGDPNLGDNVSTTTLNNSGTIIDSGARLDFNGKATLNNSGVFDVTFDGSSDFTDNFNSGNLFHNSGTLQREGTSPGTATFDHVPFQNDASGIINVVKGTLELNTNGTMGGGDFQAASGATLYLSGGASFTLTGSYGDTGSHDGQVLFDNGTLTAGVGGATFNFPSGYFNWSSNAATMTGGTFNNAATGFIQITGGDPNLGDNVAITTLNNAGTIVNSGARLDFDGKATLNNSGVFDITFDGSGDFTDNFNSGNLFHNSGTLRREGTSPGTATFDQVPFQNDADAIIDVVKGTLELNTSGTMAGGDFHAAAGATLYLSGGASFTLTGSYGDTGSHAGQILFDNGTLTPNNATFDFPSGYFNWSSNAATIANGTLNNIGFIQIVGGDPNLGDNVSTTTLDNTGTIVNSGARLDFNGKATLNNLSGALFDITFDGSGDFTDNFNSGNLFHNSGTLRREGASPGTATFDHVPFQNDATGIIDVVKGTLELNTNGTMAGGDFHAASGATLYLSGGASFTLTGNYGDTGSHDGQIVFDSGTLVPNNATFNFPSGFFNWNSNAAAIAGGTLNNAATGFIQITGGDPNLGDNVTITTLNNAGTIVNSGARLDFNGKATLNNLSGALFDVSFDGSGDFIDNFNSGNLFNNAGTLRRDGTAPGTATFDGVPFANTGTVEVDAGAFLVNTSIAQLSGNTLTGGTWDVHSGAALNLNVSFITSNAGTVILRGASPSFTGLGSLATNSGAFELLDGASFGTTSDFTNTGSVVLGPDSTFTVNGDLNEGSSSRIEFQLGGTPASGHFGKLAVTGGAMLNGTAAFSFTSYGPLTGDIFTVATFASHTGAFSAYDGTFFQKTKVLDPVLNSGSLVVNAVADGADLAVSNVSSVPSALIGQDVTINWHVTNIASSATFTSLWTDSVYISNRDSYDSSAVLVGRVVHNGTVTGGGSYNGSLTAPLPGVLPGQYHFLVISDSQGQMPDKDRTNNSAESAAAITTDVTALTPGVSLGSTIKAGQDLWFQVNVPFGETPNFKTTYAVAGEAALYVRQIVLPTTGAFDAQDFSPTKTGSDVTLYSAKAGTYYVLLHGSDAAGAGQSFSVETDALAFGPESLSIKHGANVGQVTTVVHGSLFTPSTTFSLVPSVGSPVSAAKTIFVDSSTEWVTFDLTGLATGDYGVRSTDNGSATLSNAFHVETGQAGQFSFNLTSPSFVRPPFNGAFVTLTYQNTGDTDLNAPIVFIDGNNAQLRLPTQSSFGGSYMEVLAINQSGGPAGVLPPGASGTIQLAYQPAIVGAHFVTNFSAVVASGNLALDWDEFKTSMQPQGVANDAWDAIFANFKSQVGSTYSTYTAALDADATHLSALEAVTPDPGQYVAFELQKAGDFGQIAGRYYLGALGRGQVDTFDEMAKTDSLGNVTIQNGPDVRAFAKLSNGSYQAMPGDTGTLALVGGIYHLTEINGTVTVFLANGRLNYTQDATGNKITAHYNASNQVTSLVSTNGDTLGFSYNAQGLVSQSTDAVGRTTNYTYDSSGQLLSVTNAAGTTGYTYTNGSNAASKFAPASVTNPDGTHLFFQYDSQGRMTSQMHDNSALPLTFAYDGFGTTTVTDAQNHVTTLYYGDNNQVARTVDPLGHVSSVQFNAAGLLTGASAPSGAAVGVKMGANGFASSLTDQLGNQTNLKFGGTFSKLQSLIDPNGNTTQFGYDTVGNLSVLTNPDGSQAHYSYDANGNLIATTDENGETITYTFNSHNLLTAKILPGGNETDYTYDSHRNLHTITDSSGTTTFAYDSADRLHSVTYPGGKSLTYTYDSNGRKTSVTDQDGYKTNFQYDSLGRLSQVTDGNSNVIASYTYDSIGELDTETHGNGTKTSYVYDANGHIVSITDRQSNNTVIDQFIYSYDAAGRVTQVNDSTNGITTYGYDLAGQLTSVHLQSGETITYKYDGAGNRTAVIDSISGTTNYSTNKVNEYTSAGGATFQYDADGHLVRQDNDGTTSYSYDAEGRVIGVVSPTDTFTYQYNALGGLSAVTHNGVTTSYLVDPTSSEQPFAEYNQNGLVAHYVQGIGLESRVDAGSNAAFYGHDVTGNVTLLTGSSGTVLNTYSYLPFGEKLSSAGSTPNPFTYNGQFGVLDSGSGLYSMGGRAYNPILGRFMQNDPVGLQGGDTNTYRFVENNPVGFNDPGGLVVPAAPAAVISGLGSGVPATVSSFVNGLRVAGLFSASGATGGAVSAGGGAELATAGGAWVCSTVSNPTPWLFTGSTSSGTGAVGYAACYNGAVPLTTALNANIASLSAGSVILPAAVAATGGYVVGTVADRAWQNISPGSHQAFVNGLQSAGTSLGVIPGPNNAFTNQGGFNDLNYGQSARNVMNSPGVRHYLDLTANHHPPDVDDVNNAIKLYKQQTQLERYDELRTLHNLFPSTYPDPGPPPNPTSRTETILPGDPNNILGPGGFGADPVSDVEGQTTRFDGFVPDGGDFGYSVLFENKPDASAPAQQVVITEQLDSNLDWNTFELGHFGFGNFDITVPAGLSSYTTRIDATGTLGIFVDFSAGINFTTGLVTWTFSSIDPKTGDLPLDPFSGFLPANITAPEGDGFVSYHIQPKSNIASGTNINAQATVVFDTNDPINTPLINETIDTLAPSSAVTPFAFSTSERTAFTVKWSGSDEVSGSGLAKHNIFYSDNGGPLQAFVLNTPLTAAKFTGVVGHTYQFFSQAVDNVGNTETVANTPDATIQVVAPNFVTVSKKQSFTDSDGDIYTVSINGPGTLKVAQFDPDADGKGPIDFLQVDGSTSKTSVSVAVKKNKIGGDGIVTIGDVTINGALGSFTAKASDFVVDGLTATGAVKSISVHDLLEPDAVLTHPLIKTGGAVKDKLTVSAHNLVNDSEIDTTATLSAVTAASIGDGSITAAALTKLVTTTGAMNADLSITGPAGSIAVKTGVNAGNWTAASFNSITVSGGAMDADVTTAGAIGKMTVKGGALGGDIAARNIGPVSITGGNFTGTITSLTSAATLKKTPALASLIVNSGDVDGDIRVLGAIGAIAANVHKNGIGGNIDGAVVNAAKIAAITAAKNFSDSVFLAGADLGADYALGGTSADADTFGAGTIGKIKIGGNVTTNSVIAAGVSTTQSSFDNANKAIDTIIGGIASSIAKFTIAGTAASDSYFAAGKFVSPPTIGKVKIDPLNDPRFIT